MTKLFFIFFLTTTLLAFDLPLIKDCPESPNCVSSKASKASHYVEPITFTKTPEEFQKYVEQILKKYSRVKLVRMEKNYAHLEFTSLIMRFTDDLELFFDTSVSKIHIRSASRVGYSDWGVNKKRVLQIKDTFLNPVN